MEIRVFPNEVQFVIGKTRMCFVGTHYGSRSDRYWLGIHLPETDREVHYNMMPKDIVKRIKQWREQCET